VAPARLHEVAIGSSLEVSGVRVTFLDANHCPGAAMLLFHPPGRRPVLHTGDCRLTEAAQALPELAAVRGNVDLILDTTYCDPQYAFPPQPEVLEFAVDAVKAEAFNPRTLFLFGSYTIGKERLYLEAARVLGRKVYVSATKKKVLDCLGLGPEYASLLTTDDSETSLHAVPMWMVGHKHMASALRHYRGRFDNVVGFQPTGWTHEKDAAASRRRGRRKQKGTLITYQVPYSEHSSFTELKAFVAWLQPRSILPHVNNDGGGPKAQRMIALLQGHER
jgi:DNA cross-link repair 1A protein